ncbi:hypothetical protein VTO73DRAFT_2550 [Trametes versicolor]
MSTATATSVEVDYYTLLLTGRLRSDLDEPPNEQEPFGHGFQQEESTSQTYRDIRELRQAMNEMNSVFQKVSNDLGGFDQNGLPTRDGLPVVTYHWILVRHDHFLELMWQSYSNAVVASAFMNRYCRLLPDSGNDVDMDDVPNLAIELESFMQVSGEFSLGRSQVADAGASGINKELEEEEEVAKETRYSFKTLSEDVRFFATYFTGHLQSACEQITAEITDTRARLADLQRRLNETHAKIEEWKDDRDAATAAMAFTGVAFFIIPFVGAAMTGGAIHARNRAVERLDNSRRQASSLEREINECMHHLDPLQDKEQLLNHYQQSRNATEAEIAALADKIEIISNIWQCLNVDMQNLHEQLRLALGIKTISRRFVKRLQNAHKVYSNLAVLLEDVCYDAGDAFESAAPSYKAAITSLGGRLANCQAGTRKKCLSALVLSSSFLLHHHSGLRLLFCLARAARLIVTDPHRWQERKPEVKIRRRLLMRSTDELYEDCHRSTAHGRASNAFTDRRQ